jgi:hypothetical protein
MIRSPLVAGLSLSGLAIALSCSTLQACVGDDPVVGSTSPAGGDASATPGADGSTPLDAASNDAQSAVDAAVDAGADAAPPDFCQSAAAAGAAFCVDFETGANVAAGWDSNTATNGATIIRNDAFGYNSKRSATIKLGGTNANAQGTLSKVIAAGALKSKVNIQYDGYFKFQPWLANSYNGFVTGITRTGGVLSTQYYFDLERQPTDWKLTAGDGTPKASLSTPLTADAWHHVDMTYDANVGAAVTLIVDGAIVGNLALVKGAPPNAPATFDELILNAGAENLGSALTATELTIDNVIVRFP